MPEYSAGTAYVQLLPSAKGFEAKVNTELQGINPELLVVLKPEVDPAAKQKSEQDGEQSGAAYGDAFEAAVKSRIEAALASLPDAKVGIDATDADAKIAEIKAALEDLAKAKIGVDVSEDDALAKIDDLRAQLDELARNDPSIAIRVDASDASAKLTAISDKVRELDGRNVVIDVKVDAASAAAAEAQLQAVQDSAGAGGGAGLGSAGFATLVAGGIGLGAGALGGAALATIPLAYAAIGVAAEKSNADVQQATTGLIASAKQAVQQGFAPMIPAIVSVEDQAKQTITSLEPEFAQASVAASPLLTTMSTGLLQAVKSGVDGSIPILGQLGPEAAAISTGFGQLERGVGGFLQAINPQVAAQGLSELFGDVEQILPAVGSLLNEVAPLGNALLGVAGPAAKDFATDLNVLKPVIDLVSGGISTLTPEIAAVAPPVLAVMAATKLLTGSWTDFSGASAVLKSVFTDANGEFDKGRSSLTSLASVVGINTQASRDAATADAQLAVDKANLVKAAAEQDAAEASTANLQQLSAKSALAEAEANEALAVATREASAAETTLADASEAAAFSFGPVGIALGVIGAAIGLVSADSTKATAPTADLTQELVKLAQAAPGAAAGIVAADPSLQTLIPKLATAGTSVQALSQAYAGGANDLRTYASGLQSQQNALGGTQVGLKQVGDGYQQASGNAAQTFVSIKDLTDEVNRHDIALNQLPSSLQNAVNKYNAQNDVIGQLNQSLPELIAAQQSASAVTQLSAGEQASAATQAQALGVSVGTVTQAYADLKAGVTYAIPTQLLMAQSFLSQTLAVDQAKQTVTSYFQQADQAATQAQTSVDNAVHSVGESIQSVANAQHSYAQAQDAVVTADQGVVTAQRAVADANTQVVTAQNNVTKAVVSAQQAQVNLTAAYVAAQQALKALQLQEADQVASQESDQLALIDATTAALPFGVTASNAQSVADLADTGGVTSANEAQVKAAVALVQAQNQLNDTLNTGANLQVQKDAADAAGVAGSQQVLTAQQALASANDQVASSEQQLVKAQQAVADAQAGVVSAQKGVTDAVYNEQQARLAVTSALYNEQQAQQAVTTAQQALSKAQTDASTSLDASTAAGQRNLAMLQQLSDQLYKNEDPNRAANDLINATATAFGSSKQAAADFLKQEGLIPPNFQFGVTAVASADYSAITEQLQAAGLVHMSGANLNLKADGGPIVGPGGPREDKVPIMASNGEFVVNAAATARNRGALEAINAGRYADGGYVSPNALLANAQLADVGVGYQTAVNALNIIGLPAPAGLPAYVAPSTTAASPGAGGGQLAYNGPSGVSQWAPQILQALTLLNQPASWLGTVERRMNQESGGNPVVVNKWDSNWAKGTPSVGLMQVIGPTFADNAEQFAGTGPFEYGVSTNPLANIFAGLHYAIGRYGSLSALNRPGGYDSGGWLPPGLQTVYNGTSEPEAILTNDQWQMLAGNNTSANSGGQFTGSLYLDNGQFLGVVRGEIDAANEATGNAIMTGTR